MSARLTRRCGGVGSSLKLLSALSSMSSGSCVLESALASGRCCRPLTCSEIQNTEAFRSLDAATLATDGSAAACVWCCLVQEAATDTDGRLVNGASSPSAASGSRTRLAAMPSTGSHAIRRSVQRFQGRERRESNTARGQGKNRRRRLEDQDQSRVLAKFGARGTAAGDDDGASPIETLGLAHNTSVMLVLHDPQVLQMQEQERFYLDAQDEEELDEGPETRSPPQPRPGR